VMRRDRYSTYSVSLAQGLFENPRCRSLLCKGLSRRHALNLWGSIRSSEGCEFGRIKWCKSSSDPEKKCHANSSSFFQINTTSVEKEGKVLVAI